MEPREGAVARKILETTDLAFEASNGRMTDG
jgi:hypothetical protein